MVANALTQLSATTTRNFQSYMFWNPPLMKNSDSGERGIRRCETCCHQLHPDLFNALLMGLLSGNRSSSRERSLISFDSIHPGIGFHPSLPSTTCEEVSREDFKPVI